MPVTCTQIDRSTDRQTDKMGQRYITICIVWFLPIVNYKNGSIHRLAKRHGVDSVWSHRCIDDNGAGGDGDDDDDAFQSINCCDFPVYCSISMYWHRAKDRFAQNQNAFVDYKGYTKEKKLGIILNFLRKKHTNWI